MEVKIVLLIISGVNILITFQILTRAKWMNQISFRSNLNVKRLF